MNKTLLVLSFLTGTLLEVVAQPFVTTWQSDNTGSSGDTQIIIPTEGDGYDYDIYWEEIGNETHNGNETNVTGDITLDFGSAGTYRVEISGDFPRIYINKGGDKSKILTVESWGNIAWTSMERAFHGCDNLTVPATDAPDLSGVTNMSLMFNSASTFNGDIGHWDVSNVEDFNSMFSGASSFNQDIGNWNMSSATNLGAMFYAAVNFDQDIGNWNVSKVTNMSYMFSGGYLTTTIFNQDINGWDVGLVTNMQQMFHNATSFNQDLNDWDVSKVTNMIRVFYNATDFNGDIGAWDVGAVTDMLGMFQGAASFNQDLNDWDVSAVEDMNIMFTGAADFNGDISDWDIGNVTTTNGMFSNATSFNQDIGGWDMSKVTIVTSMFSGASSFNQDIGDWTFSNVSKLSHMFFNATDFNQDIGEWEVGQITDFKYMFNGASSFNQDISGWNVSNAETMERMFYGATSFDQNLGDWDVSKVTIMNLMFTDCGLASGNYDGILQGWASQTVQTGISIAASAFYCAGADARQTLIDDYGWAFSGDGLGCTQTITFDVLAKKVMGDADFLLEATASSNLSVSFSSSDEDVATVSGGLVTIVGVGTTTITASQEGDDDYDAATPVDQDFTVLVGDQSITFDPLTSKTYLDEAFELTATASSGLDVTYSSSNTEVATVANNVVTIVGAGVVTITASQNGDANYNAATPVDQELTINKADQAISFAALDPKAVDDEDFELSATGGGSNNEVTYTSSDLGVAVISQGMVTIVGAGTTTITASQEGDSDFNAAESVEQELVVNKLNQSITFESIDDQVIDTQSITLNAVASSGLDVEYEILDGPATVAENVLTFTGSGIVTVQASQDGNEEFNQATEVDQTFTISEILEIQEKKNIEIEIYPNPMSDHLMLYGNLNGKNLEVQIFNQMGQQLLMNQYQNLSTHKLKIQLESLKKGIYLLSVRSGSTSSIHRIQVMR